MLRSRIVIGALFLAVVTLAPGATAQERPAGAVEFAAGALVFADDGSPAEGFVGGAARVYVGDRLSIGPEIAYVSGEAHSHLLVTGNLTFDLVRSGTTRSASVTPFLTAGGGLFQTREQFSGEVFTSSEGTFTAGGGVRVRAGRRVYVGAEARVGWELHLRLNGMVGIELGR